MRTEKRSRLPIFFLWVCLCLAASGCGTRQQNSGQTSPAVFEPQERKTEENAGEAGKETKSETGEQSGKETEKETGEKTGEEAKRENGEKTETGSAGTAGLLPPEETAEILEETAKSGTEEGPSDPVADHVNQAIQLSAQIASESFSVQDRTTEHSFEGLEGRNLVINGDSRTVGLFCSLAYDAEEFPKHLFYHISEDYSGAVGNIVFVGKGGEGYNWFSTYGLAFAARHFDENSVLAVWFGVNDPENAANYVTYMNNVSLQWGIPVYYLTVGPCYDHWAEREGAVEEMNRMLYEGLREEITVIDVWQFIRDGMDRGEFGTQDGLHYNYYTCNAVNEFVYRSIDEDLQKR